VALFRNLIPNPYLRYTINRWLLPRLGNEPLANKNLSLRAWPKVSALTSELDYTDRIECIEWQSTSNSDGTDLLETYARTSRPVVLKGYATSSIESLWELEWVKQKAGAKIARIRVGDYASAPGDPERVQMPLADFVDYLLGQRAFPRTKDLVDNSGAYAGNIAIPVLEKYLPHPRFLGEEFGANFWLGGASSRTPLHCHQHGDFLLIQLIGRRRVVLIPPHQALLLGYLPVNMNICTAAFDPFMPDRDQFPGMDLVHQLHGDLVPGDALLIPGYWFHAVQLPETSMSVTLVRKSMPAAVGGGPRGPWRSRPYSRGW
jgi:hypothetical protein